MGPGAGGAGSGVAASAAIGAATGATGSAAGGAVAELAAPSESAVGAPAAGESATAAWPEAATKLLGGLFRTCGCAGRCGAWAQAASARSVGTRSEWDRRLMGGVGKFRTF